MIGVLQDSEATTIPGHEGQQVYGVHSRTALGSLLVEFKWLTFEQGVACAEIHNQSEESAISFILHDQTASMYVFRLRIEPHYKVKIHLPENVGITRMTWYLGAADP
jgi:hypothetical protein